MTLRPEEREGIDQVQRSLVGVGRANIASPGHCTPRSPAPGGSVTRCRKTKAHAAEGKRGSSSDVT